jgi:hypothetical protein
MMEKRDKKDQACEEIVVVKKGGHVDLDSRHVLYGSRDKGMPHNLLSTYVERNRGCMGCAKPCHNNSGSISGANPRGGNPAGVANFFQLNACGVIICVAFLGGRDFKFVPWQIHKT